MKYYRHGYSTLMSLKDVYLAMCALVGVRGSISAKTTGVGQAAACLSRGPRERKS